MGVYESISIFNQGCLQNSKKKKFLLFFPFSQENVIATRQDNPYSIKSIKFKNISKFKFTP